MISVICACFINSIMFSMSDLVQLIIQGHTSHPMTSHEHGSTYVTPFVSCVSLGSFIIVVGDTVRHQWVVLCILLLRVYICKHEFFGKGKDSYETSERNGIEGKKELLLELRRRKYIYIYIYVLTMRKN